MSDLSTVCGCGHKACYHPTMLQQAERRESTGGRFSGECTGGTSTCCRCITSREEVTTHEAAPVAETRL